MGKNEGKKFEEDFQKSVPKDWFCYRLKDSAGSWSNTGASRFTPRNSCDFFIFTGSKLFGTECKSFKGKSLPFSNISDKQLEDLHKMSLGKPYNVLGLLVLNFRDLNETYAISPLTVIYLKGLGERKSISFDEVRANGMFLPQSLKRTRFRYDLSVLDAEL